MMGTKGVPRSTLTVIGGISPLLLVVAAGQSKLSELHVDIALNVGLRMRLLHFLSGNFLDEYLVEMCCS